VRVAPRIVMGTEPPQERLQSVVFHPVEGQRVISSYTAAEMRSMMQKVVLEGTGRKANLEGYSSAGKTGTAQKVDPDTGAYSKTKYVGSFAGFAPMNNPQVVVAVILDSAVGLHQGGQVAAPVFTRITQQVLEYMHVPHDLPLNPKHQLLMAQSKVNDKDLDDDTPDHPGEPLETAEMNSDASAPAKPKSVERASSPSAAGAKGNVVQAGIREPIVEDFTPVTAQKPNAGKTDQSKLPATGTVILDVERGGIEVPSFVGKTVRSAVEAAQDAGLELEPVGSGVGRTQTPAAGTHVAGGARVTVQFGR
jgi:cell division protein FtsI (penicillin-binding protein 3)